MSESQQGPEICDVISRKRYFTCENKKLPWQPSVRLQDGDEDECCE